jgi:hypothetical protein
VITANKNPLIPLFTVLLAGLVLAACGGNIDSDTTDSGVDVTPTSDCLWVGPYVKENQGFNFAYPDSGAIYWSAAYTLPEDGSYITLESEYPYSRYMSYNSYREDTSPAQSLTDENIAPDPGSVNPFIAGNPRNDPSRSYSITVLAGEPPAGATAATGNTLYDATTSNGEQAVLLYRNYVPNSGQDQTGGAGLPRVTLHLADGSTKQGEEACAALQASTTALAIPLVPPQIYEDHRATWDPWRNPPVFRATYGIPFLLQCDFRGDCTNNPERNTRFYANADNQYIYSFISRSQGEIVVLRGRLPTTPKTLNGDDFTSDGQLRYWSMCQNEFYSQKVTECLYDEQIEVNADGFYTIITSRLEDRPDNATAGCGVGFIPWTDDGDGFSIIEGRQSTADDAFLLVRNMLPAPDFAEAIQNTRIAGDEAEVMGEYLPRARYFSKAEFEGLGCNPYLSLPYEDM